MKHRQDSQQPLLTWLHRAQSFRLPLKPQRETRGLPSPCSDESGALDLGTSEQGSRQRVQPVPFAMPSVTGWCWTSTTEAFGSAVRYQSLSEETGIPRRRSGTI